MLIAPCLLYICNPAILKKTPSVLLLNFQGCCSFYMQIAGHYLTTEQLYSSYWYQIKKLEIGLYLVISIVASTFPTSECLLYILCSLHTVLLTAQTLNTFG